jgi:hypothetical protein
MSHTTLGTVTVCARGFRREDDVRSLTAMRSIVAIHARHLEMLAVIEPPAEEPTVRDDGLGYGRNVGC